MIYVLSLTKSHTISVKLMVLLKYLHLFTMNLADQIKKHIWYDLHVSCILNILVL